MEIPKILIVEDEAITAQDVKCRLEPSGYAVPAIASSGRDVVLRVAETNPDPVLMDIRLRGEMDGVEAAQAIRARFDLPVICLTMYADQQTVQRAKLTEPYATCSSRLRKRKSTRPSRWPCTSMAWRRG